MLGIPGDGAEVQPGMPAYLGAQRHSEAPIDTYFRTPKIYI